MDERRESLRALGGPLVLVRARGGCFWEPASWWRNVVGSSTAQTWPKWYIDHNALVLPDGTFAFVEVTCPANHHLRLDPKIHTVTSDGYLSTVFECPKCREERLDFHIDSVKLAGWSNVAEPQEVRDDSAAP